MNLYSQLYPNESFSEQDFYEAVRYVLGDNAQYFTQEQLENALLDRVDMLSEDEAENLWKSLGNIARNVGQGVLKVASVAAPIAGMAVGTAIGGPAGAQIGSMVGNLAGNLAGAGSDALARKPAAKQKLRQVWQQTKGVVGDVAKQVGQQAVSTVQQYAANNPVQLTPQVSQNIGAAQGILAQLTALFQNPQLLASMAQQTLGTASPNAPTDEGYSFAEMIESLHYLTEDLLTEYYENGILPNQDYTYDRYGRLIPLNPSRLAYQTESILNY